MCLCIEMENTLKKSWQRTQFQKWIRIWKGQDKLMLISLCHSMFHGGVVIGSLPYQFQVLEILLPSEYKHFLIRLMQQDIYGNGGSCKMISTKMQKKMHASIPLPHKYHSVHCSALGCLNKYFIYFTFNSCKFSTTWLRLKCSLWVSNIHLVWEYIGV